MVLLSFDVTEEISILCDKGPLSIIHTLFVEAGVMNMCEISWDLAEHCGQFPRM